MKLISQGYTTAASSFAVFSQQGSVAGEAVGIIAAGGFRIDAIQLNGGSSITSTVPFKFRYGQTTADSTLDLAVSGSSVLDYRVDGLGIIAPAGELVAPTT